MATNKQNDKTQAEDQAFIQSLYDDLSAQQGNDATDHPSEQLDQRILAAAHKAVATKALASKAMHHPVQKRKKMAWYYPAAMAASVLLVLTIVNHQLSAPINPAYEAPLVSMEQRYQAAQNDSLAAPVAKKDLRSFSEQTEWSLDTQQALTDKKLVEESDDAFLESGESLIASAEAPALAEKKAMKSSRIKQQSKTEIASEPFFTNNLLSKQKLDSSLPPTALSYEKYKALQAQSKQKTLYWRLQEENDSSYVIELFQTEQNSVFYRLNKHSFQLKLSSEDKRQPFAEIIYIAEK